MATTPSEQAPEKDTGTGACPISTSFGHNLADSAVELASARSGHNLAETTDTDQDSVPMEDDALLRTPESLSAHTDPDASRGSSILRDSPDNDDHGNRTETSSPMDTSEHSSQQSSQSSSSTSTTSSDTPPPAPDASSSHRPCSPPRWLTAQRSIRLQRLHCFNVATASLPLPERRGAERGSSRGQLASASRGRGSSWRARGRRSFERGGVSHRTPDASRTYEWRDWRIDLPEATPEGYTHHLAHLHPWAPLVRPRRPRYANITSDCVTSDLPLETYRPIPPSGYQGARFVRSLFPVFIRDAPRPSNKIPVMELQTLEAAIQFRQESLALITSTMEGTYQEPVRKQRQTPLKSYSSTLAPPSSGSFHPVLYQVVAVGYGNGVILEAKDFFVIGPDRRDLHCIVLEQYAIDVTTNMRGFDRSLISVKDLVWVYSLTPTRAALRDPTTILERSRIPRAAAMDPSTAYFFRVDRFALVTPHVHHKTGLGIVVHLVTRADRVTKFLAVFEGAPEAVVVTPSICDSDLNDIYLYSLVLAETRLNTSCAIRFSEPPVSVQAREELCQLASRFLPVNASEGVLPLRVMNLRPKDIDWLTDRANDFNSFTTDPGRSKHRMGRLFNVSCSTLAAMANMLDDTAVRWVTLTLPRGSMCPLRLDFVLEDMPHDAGWTKGRSLDFWVTGAEHTTKMRVESVVCNLESKQLSIRIAGFTWNHSGLMALIERHGRLLNGQVIVDGYVRLAKPTKSANPANEAVSRMLHIVERVESGTIGHQILDMVYRKPSTSSAAEEPGTSKNAPTPSYPDTFRLKNQSIALTPDQKSSLQLGMAGHPIAEIQAAFGTGKTVLGAIIAGLLIQNKKGPIIVTSTTNNAVANFTNTMLAIAEFRQVRLLRYVSESAFLDESPSTPVDIHEILKSLGDDFDQQLRSHEHEHWERFRRGRELYERYATDPERSMNMSAAEIEEYILAEKDVSECVKRVVNAMFRVRMPDVLLLTTASLLNTTATGGIFKTHLADRAVIIIDEASQVPEPVFASLVTMFPDARQLYIGDAHQMRPHVKCPTEANPALFGARSIMTVLARAPGVPKSALVTTFRAHPALNALPNTLVYRGSLINGAAADDRSLLLGRLRFPNPQLPFVLVDVEGSSTRALSHSHLNEDEASVCASLMTELLRAGLRPSQICVVTFYREQFRLLLDYAAERHIEIATVDSVQGREVEVIILLTTRTDFAPEASEFIDDLRRLNVAITRCRQGQFILGHVATLRTLPNWGAVVRWAEGANAVLPPSHLQHVFHNQ